MSPTLRTFALTCLLAVTAGCDLEVRARLPFSGHPTVHVVYRQSAPKRPGTPHDEPGDPE